MIIEANNTESKGNLQEQQGKYESVGPGAQLNIFSPEILKESHYDLNVVIVFVGNSIIKHFRSTLLLRFESQTVLVYHLVNTSEIVTFPEGKFVFPATFI